MELKAFAGDEHRPFFLAGATSTAVLMVHGFPGTPAELRPLAEEINRMGLTVHVPLLPGFGEEIATLSTRSANEWIGAASAAFASLQQRHERVVVVGFSMGAAISLHLATGPERPAALILLAPFWQLGETWQQPFWPLLRLLVRQFRPFEKADFDDPRFRQDLQRSMPEADPDDPATRKAIREISFSFRILDQLRALGRSAWRVAPVADLPVTVLQGRQDAIVPPARTRRLIDRFPRAVDYVELDSDHQLVDPQRAAWPQIVSIINDCLRSDR